MWVHFTPFIQIQLDFIQCQYLWGKTPFSIQKIHFFIQIEGETMHTAYALSVNRNTFHFIQISEESISCSYIHYFNLNTSKGNTQFMLKFEKLVLESL